MSTSKKPTTYVTKISATQAEQLGPMLADRGWDMREMQYTFWQARKDKTTVTAYQSGKLTAQGKGLEDFVLFILEPEILKTSGFGYQSDSNESPDAIGISPADFTPHGGIDESGKGDFFGPLVVCACYVDQNSYAALIDAGVQDSKAIKSDRKIRTIATAIKRIVGDAYSVVKIGNESYNRMYEKIGNLNRLLAWGHARSIENLLGKVPECKQLLADKFANERVLQQALMPKGKKVKLNQKTKAESDVAVAAASILARDLFVREMERMGQELGMKILPKGAGRKVDETAAEIVKKIGFDELAKYAKLHFKTIEKVRNILGK
ncbi:MAG: ribonuclease HIII [Victivallaceae bacterium]|nr:ribonuclease HIII [Victivallaceae bacterium]